MVSVRNKFRVPSGGCLLGCLLGCHPQRRKLNMELYLPRTLSAFTCAQLQKSCGKCNYTLAVVFFNVLCKLQHYHRGYVCHCRTFIEVELMSLPPHKFALSCVVSENKGYDVWGGIPEERHFHQVS